MRAFLYLATLTTVVLTAGADAWLSRTGFDPITFSAWVFVPIGAFVVGIAATSGAAIAAYVTHRRLGRIDAVVLVLMGLSCVALIEVFEYVGRESLNHGSALTVEAFWRDLSSRLTTNHLLVGPGLRMDAGPLGSIGFLLFGLRIVAFALGGFSTFGFVMGLPTCISCPRYLRKIRLTHGGDVSAEEAAALMRRLSSGDVDDIQGAIAWRSRLHFKRRDRRSRILYRLYECPRCRCESLIATPLVIEGKKVKVLSSNVVRRNFASNVSLRVP